MKRRSLDDQFLRNLAEHYDTPLYIYNLDIVRNRIEDLRSFDVIRYAQKASSNIHLLQWLRAQGVQVDAVSTGEVQRALRAGFPPEEIVFTADLFDQSILRLLEEHDIPVNLGSPDMIEQYAAIRPGRNVTLRINPGFGHGHDRKVTTGGEESKHGIWHEELPEILTRATRAGLRVTGLHIHIGSGTDFEHLLPLVRETMHAAVLKIRYTITTFSVGGGLPTPYRPEDMPFQTDHYCREWLETKKALEGTIHRSLTMEVEPGRYLVAEAGMLLTEVRGTKRSGNIDYILVDAGYDNLIRPAMYGAYHHISVLGKDTQPTTLKVVAGPLCESADVFTQAKGSLLDPRSLPDVKEGDLLCIHDAGAYTASMASNYNSRLLAPEVMVENHVPRLIRRRQTIEDLLTPENDITG